MPRTRRRITPGVVYHLISRFVDREWFITAGEERAHYLALLGSALAKSDWICLAYAIMSNHIHLALRAGKDPLASWLRRVHSPFANWMNEVHDRIGPLFVRGPKGLPVAPDGVGTVIAYIHNNPVRAQVVDAAGKSTWTSHRAYLGLEVAPEWLHVPEGLHLSGFSDPQAFDAWVTDPARGDVELERMSEPDLVLGTPARDRVAPPLLVQAAAEELCISVAQLCSRRRSRLNTLGRQIVVHAGHELGMRNVDIANALSVSHQAVSLIAHRGQLEDVRAIAARVLLRVAANDDTRATTLAACA